MDGVRVDVAVEPGMAGVLSGQLVQMRDGSLFYEFHIAANFDVARGVVGVDDEERDARVAAHVAPFAAFGGGVDASTLAVEVAPHEAQLRLAVGHQGRQHGRDGARQQVNVGGRDRDGHDGYYFRASRARRLRCHQFGRQGLMSRWL